MKYTIPMLDEQLPKQTETKALDISHEVNWIRDEKKTILKKPSSKKYSNGFFIMPLIRCCFVEAPFLGITRAHVGVKKDEKTLFQSASCCAFTDFSSIFKTREFSATRRRRRAFFYFLILHSGNTTHSIYSRE